MANNFEQMSVSEISYPVDTVILSKEGYAKAKNLQAVASEEKIKETKKVLVVEDDIITQDVLGLFLNDIFELDYASTADEAIEKVRTRNYMAVLMDINLGRGRNGLHVTNEIRNMKGKENLPIIAQTAFAMRGDKEEFLEAGCDYYLSKPFTKEELRDILYEIKMKSH